MRTGITLTAVIAISGLISLACGALAEPTATPEPTPDATIEALENKWATEKAERTAEAPAKHATQTAEAPAISATNQAKLATRIAANAIRATAQAPRHRTATHEARGKPYAIATATALRSEFKRHTEEYFRQSEIYQQMYEDGKITYTQWVEWERIVGRQWGEARRALEAFEATLEAE